jgi:hypothetical protein
MPRQKPTPLGGIRPPYGTPPVRRGAGANGKSAGGNNASLYPLTAKQQRKKRPVLVYGIGVFVVAVIFSAVWNPPTGSVHSFTKASDYNSAKESGCTNSGGGCHGSETAYTDFNKYHPEAKCTTCHDYQGVGCIPCHAPAEHECALCHDGSMDKAVDAVRLGDSYPKGHYRQTKHGATGTDMTQPVTVTTTDSASGRAAVGKASATCEECHSIDLRDAHTGVPVVAGSTYGTDIGCGECHNDVRTGAQAAVKAKWKARTCEACHAVGSAAAMHGVKTPGVAKAADSAGCAETGTGCHDSLDLHALHPDAPKKCSGSASDGEPGCHDFKVEASKPQTKSCGSESASETCHPAYVPGQLGHKRDTVVHAPSTSIPAGDTSYYGTPCGGCHLMAADGTSLMDEHALATSEKNNDAQDPCRDCHNDPASAEAIANDWSAKDTANACGACHGTKGLDPVHAGSNSAKHAVNDGSQGCAETGPGCHPTALISDVAPATVAGGLHASCLRCHDPKKADGNFAYDPTKSTCGLGRDCHNGGYDPKSAIHTSKAGRVGGTDAKHAAGAAQRGDMLWDDASGVGTSCGVCHEMTLGNEHTRPNSPMPAGKSGCLTCHNKNLGTAKVVKASWSAKTTREACAACHDGKAAPEPHAQIALVHGATEIGAENGEVPGSCVKGGCHGTTDVRTIHRRVGCTIDGCHSSEGDIRGHQVMSCGGTDAATSCHAGYSAEKHFDVKTGKPVDHSANLNGVVNGVSYGAGANTGCFGCHDTDLQVEHARELNAGVLDGGGSGPCVVCHGNIDDPATNSFAKSRAVVAAIDGGDKRCVACHKSATSSDGPDAVASPHKQITADNPLPKGKVWADPFDEWKVAFEATTGGGHNVLSPDVVGSASAAKSFPIESFEVSGTAYTWALPANSGATAWLKASVFGTATVADADSIRHIRGGCNDCHVLPTDMAGPHGSSVHVGIDPAYSQTEYANPTAAKNQFRATGTDRVVCMKCHNMESSISPSVKPGGNAVHADHVFHASFSSSDPRRQGEKCIDCHVRIPHAWRRPRLLVRTLVASDGVEPDSYPYVRTNHRGLQGIVLKSYVGPTDLKSRYCVTGGCHPSPSASSHPRQSDLGSTSYWP